MKTLKYTLYKGRAYLCEVDMARGKSLAFEFSDSFCGALVINGVHYPVSMGKCEIKPSSLSDGNYTPELVGDGVHTVLDTLAIQSGTARIFHSEKVLADLWGELLEIKKTEDSLGKAITRLNDAVFGKKIF